MRIIDSHTHLDNHNPKKLLEMVNHFGYEKYGVMFRRIVTDPIELTSTEIRRAVREGKDISALVPEGVAEFIRDNGLYREEQK